MSRINLYVHYDSVTNHVMTRAINLVSDDFTEQYIPSNMILAEAPAEFGRYDVQTNFKILRGQTEVFDYMEICRKENIRMSNWIDFETVELMHQLEPSEIAELLYLFHAHKTLRSAFFYKMQNNYVFLTLPNGLHKTYYRHVAHFYPRFQRVMQERMSGLVNEGKSRLFGRRADVQPFPLAMVEELSPLFASGIKINFTQASQRGGVWTVPIMIIEDELTLLSQDQSLDEVVAQIMYDTKETIWRLELNVSLEG